ncbi:NAD(P)-dependent dehydrogenase (short-subunit alcohol dehydrogenase family) [Leeuwenhoekiella aestuarii]|uniref:NAD(P)-dependent dehydrogenase (Short-subunit alcohol dehydrogenase family) n=1 Tax=Leeuwenhoekiella aestuarii TaxID=2249426 RepID=A0A4Q0NR19_9FLAO|nr:SDR family oxidoreductase [Leeuwenhoekiella aestuarii]RXG12015.1 NAD(P)-dependent dehydrogenase (short-subunit alcohol dehydrogenase family) [Leeuwenhoekiella aestuarii]RXG13573.1 NAD(P)-dependent dehydrogenase (short-subunit alcohol dehydrogenase family) [Leeuwenhoekiella aestuarii]
MKQKIAIVTGGNAGLGFATAKKLCDENIITYIIGRNPEKTEKAREELGPNARSYILDLSELDKIPQAIAHITDESGGIDILVNNAGVNMKKDFLEVEDDEFQRIIHTNLTSVFVISREVTKVMKKQNSGSIINISSMAAQYGIPKVVAYTASKSAIEGMTRSMAVDLAQYGIRVNCVAPGFIKTNMSSKALDSDPERKNKVLGRTPMAKLGEPSDIGDTVFYYASDLSKFTTGTVLCVDGGNSIGF